MDKFEIVNVPTQRVKANQASIGNYLFHSFFSASYERLRQIVRDI